MAEYYVRTVNNRAGHQIGYEVYDLDTSTGVARFMNRDFGGVAFFRRAHAAAESKKLELNLELNLELRQQRLKSEV